MTSGAAHFIGNFVPSDAVYSSSMTYLSGINNNILKKNNNISRSINHSRDINLGFLAEKQWRVESNFTIALIYLHRQALKFVNKI